ncbi:hypothetical protein BLL42_01450 [Pseudomonas frederiksbergensis]|uniref:Uncharacterized protein n=1 Tax=Pseudomonas frederiksbergensis TaxID=104087 RepID=A0A1J0EEI7_9PSED|nr:hypothetical protein [Pseudomonas frederiksbergensis]APC14462.1 hypothetical protein BLL42_01450 [Pseudomonas frederiksbergensis]
MASSFQEQKLTAEQVRNNYRANFFTADPLIEATIVDAMPGDADGLMPIGKIDAAINVTIPLWSDRPPIGFGQVNKLALEWLPESSSDYLPIGTAEDIPDSDTLPDADFPLKKVIPLEIFKNYEGTFKFRYTVTNWNDGGSRLAPEVPVTIDRTGPIRPATPAPIEIVEPLITDAVLTRDGGVKCVVPDFIEDKKDFVKVAVGWMKDLPEDEADFPERVAFFDLLPSDRTILVPASFVTAIGSAIQYAVYFLFDKAGNRSEMSLPKSVQAALGELPSGLKACTVPLADDGLIDRADAAFPTKVHIEEYTGVDDDDGIVITWGKNNLARTSVGAHRPFPLKIPVSWLHMAREYDFASTTHVQPIDVDYTVFRGDYPTSSPGKISVNTDFAITGPVNPNPEPISPTLELIRFESSSGSDKELTIADIGKPATGHIKLFTTPAPVVGDTLTLYYNGKAVSSAPYVVTGNETPAQEIPMAIPWDDIKLVPVMDNLPLHYTLTHTGFANPQESRRTTINVMVEVVTLPEITVPAVVINCSHLREDGSGKWGVYVRIPTSDYLKEGAQVVAVWNTYKVDKVTEIPTTYLVEELTVSKVQEQTGIDWFIPYEKCLKPTYVPGVSNAGLGKVTYGINIRGQMVASDVKECLIGVFEDAGSGNDHCVIPRP